MENERTTTLCQLVIIIMLPLMLMGGGVAIIKSALKHQDYASWFDAETYGNITNLTSTTVTYVYPDPSNSLVHMLGVQKINGTCNCSTVSIGGANVTSVKYRTSDPACSIVPAFGVDPALQINSCDTPFYADSIDKIKMGGGIICFISAIAVSVLFCCILFGRPTKVVPFTNSRSVETV